MVFSNAVIQHGAENPAAFVDHCVLGQPCYGRFYLAHSLRDAAHDDYAQVITLRAVVDGTPLPVGKFAMTPNWSTYNFTLFRAPDDTTPWEHPKWFLSDVASRLAPGDHALELEVRAVTRADLNATGKPIASGKITFTVPEDGPQIAATALARENQIMAAAKAAYEAQFECHEDRDCGGGKYCNTNYQCVPCLGNGDITAARNEECCSQHMTPNGVCYQ
jgi:hypothetical protein